MRNAKALLALLLVASVVLAAILYYSDIQSEQQTALQKDDPRFASQKQDAVASSTESGTAEGGEPQEAVTLRPSFDVVRVEKDGSVVMAGQAEAGATVTVRSGNSEIGTATANENGEWILQQDEKLEPREHAIELSARSPGGDAVLYSKQRLALSLRDPKEGEPLVALTEQGKATRILQMPTPEMLDDLADAKAAQEANTLRTAPERLSAGALPATSVGDPAADNAGQPDQTAAVSEGEAEPETVVGFASVDYEDADQKSMIFINGIGTPGSRVAVYVDNNFAGFAETDASGSWNFSDNRQLVGGTHVIRADILEKSSNSVLARAEVNFERQAIADTKNAFFDQGTKTIATADEIPETESPSAPKVIVVKQGDTLWQIAERYYGEGARYTKIFQNNRNQIRNPNRIYPAQQFVLPDDDETSSLNQ